MKLLKKNAREGDSGFVFIEPETTEDMYAVYGLVSIGDNVTAFTFRNVTKERDSGSTSKSRIKMKLKLRVEDVTFDIHEFTLRIKGRNVEEKEYVKMGQYHTLDLEIGRSLSIEKDSWDAMHLESLTTACDPVKSAELAAIMMHEGYANICLVTTNMTIVKRNIDRKLPKKKSGVIAYEKARNLFFEEVYESIKRFVDFDVVKVIILASPGFVKDEFYTFMLTNAAKNEDTIILKNKGKFFKVHASSGHKKALDEVLSKPENQSQLGDVKAAAEVRSLNRFHTLLAKQQENWCCYGYDDVLWADKQLLIEELLLTDTLFRASDVHQRQKYVSLVKDVREHGGKVHIFSSLHVSGEQLALYTGVAAILRGPLPEIEEEVENEGLETLGKPKRLWMDRHWLVEKAPDSGSESEWDDRETVQSLGHTSMAPEVEVI